MAAAMLVGSKVVNRQLATLFPTLRGELLAATLTRPDKWWYLSELAGYLQTTPSSLQRELKALVAGGILQQRRDGTRTYFKAETRSPLFPELRGLIEKTARRYGTAGLNRLWKQLDEDTAGLDLPMYGGRFQAGRG